MGANRKKFHGFSRAQRSALRSKKPQFEVKSVEKVTPVVGQADEEPRSDKEDDQDMDDQSEPQQGTESGSEGTEQENSAGAKRVKDQDHDRDHEKDIAAKRHKAEHETKGPSESNGEMTKEERKKMKKEAKLLAKKSLLDGGRPSFMISRSHPKLKLKDVRDLIVYLLTETPTLPWIMVKNKFNIHNVVVLYISGLDPQFFNVDLADPESHRPVAWSEKALSGPVTEFQELRKFFDYMTSESAEKKSAEFHMLTLDELKDSDYPLPTYLSPGSELQEGWIETDRPTWESTAPPPPKKLLAMDCEMCRTSAGSELTRISVLDESGETIYDTLVIPDNPIVDYLTQYSGMTAERLAGVTTTLKDVQAELKKLVSYDNILVGHSLENDMKVLKPGARVALCETGSTYDTKVVETVKAVQEAVITHGFVWARLRGMEINHGKVPEADATAGQLIGTGRDSAVPCSTKTTASDEEIREAARRMDIHIAQIVESLPANTALMVLSGQGDYREVSRMQQRQKNFQKLYNTLHLSQIPPEDHFLEADQVRLEEAIDQAKNGVCFLMVK
ncbi:hypothetical protein BGZ82_000632 [Podila clonocystis]|nr:hypothetical protein BGZ82_000632 [Podila clonocystis]